MIIYDICMNKLKTGQGFFCLYDGSSCSSFGLPTKPILFDYNEFLELCTKLKEKFDFDLIKKFRQENNFAFLLPENISKFLNKKVCGIYYPYVKEGKSITKTELLDFFFRDFDEMEASQKEKIKLMNKLNLIPTNCDLSD